jgi:hypothetical protein
MKHLLVKNFTTDFSIHIWTFMLLNKVTRIVNFLPIGLLMETFCDFR